jgi:hypothetical protein
MNHIFVDYENTRTIDASVLTLERTTFTILLGPQNTKFDITVVEQLIARAGSVEIVRLEKVGKNAVDFALAYYLGRKVAGDSGAYFHIVSKDRDYEPLVEHLKARHVHIRQHKDFATLATAIMPKAKTAPTGAAKKT